ncbi:MAG: helix-turn-helix transcriptional regulator [Bacilli bacterium]|nr:helix-turn-helix transcriptional regulator [Bacilli bacterium]MDD4733233.1 helix-turn-helix transcriptional regulator [Bacilli bacterium]
MFFKRLKELRNDFDYTQEFVSSYLKIHRVVYSRYETGNREIPISYLIKLSELYDVSIDYIVENGVEKRK